MCPQYQEDEVDRYFRMQEQGISEDEPKEEHTYVDEEDRLRRQLVHDEKVVQCAEYSKKYMSIFSLMVINIVLAVGSLAIAILAIANIRFTIKHYQLITNILYGISLTTFVLYILQGVIILSLGKFVYDFRTAGMLLMLRGALVALRTSFGGVFGSLCGIGVAVTSILYILKFVTALSSSFDNVATYMAITWDNFKKLYTYFYIAWGIAMAVSLAPIYGMIGQLFLAILEILEIVLIIWEVVLIFRSALVMKQYSQSIFAV